jgi:hypothetical protein
MMEWPLPLWLRYLVQRTKIPFARKLSFLDCKRKAPIAESAIAIGSFALATWNAARHIGGAFQASSPKTFKADPSQGRPFFCFINAFRNDFARALAFVEPRSYLARSTPGRLPCAATGLSEEQIYGGRRDADSEIAGR